MKKINEASKKRSRMLVTSGFKNFEMDLRLFKASV